MEALILALRVFVVLTYWPVILFDHSLTALQKHEDAKLERCERALEARPLGDARQPEECK